MYFFFQSGREVRSSSPLCAVPRSLAWHVRSASPSLPRSTASGPALGRPRPPTGSTTAGTTPPLRPGRRTEARDPHRLPPTNSTAQRGAGWVCLSCAPPPSCVGIKPLVANDPIYDPPALLGRPVVLPTQRARRAGPRGWPPPDALRPPWQWDYSGGTPTLARGGSGSLARAALPAEPLPGYPTGAMPQRQPAQVCVGCAGRVAGQRGFQPCSLRTATTARQQERTSAVARLCLCVLGGMRRPIPPSSLG